MCLGVPGKIISMSNTGDDLDRWGKVSFGGLVKEVNLAYVPEAQVGDYVIVHVGFAISRLDEMEAQQIFAYLCRIDALEDLDESAALSALAGGGA